MDVVGARPEGDQLREESAYYNIPFGAENEQIGLEKHLFVGC